MECSRLVGCLFDFWFWQEGHIVSSPLCLCRVGWPLGRATIPKTFFISNICIRLWDYCVPI